MRSVEDRARRLISEHLGVDMHTITDVARLTEDLGADSLDAIEIVMAMEEEFGIEVADAAMEKVRTFGDAVNLLHESGAK